MFLIIAGCVTLTVWLYVMGRDWLDEHLQGTAYSYWHENIEDKLWEKSRTILAARLYWVGGIIIAVHDLAAAAGVDWTPILTEIGNHIPTEYRGLAAAGALILTGIAFEWLRRITTAPVGEKA